MNEPIVIEEEGQAVYFQLPSGGRIEAMIKNGRLALRSWPGILLVLASAGNSIELAEAPYGEFLKLEVRVREMEGRKE